MFITTLFSNISAFLEESIPRKRENTLQLNKLEKEKQIQS